MMTRWRTLIGLLTYEYSITQTLNTAVLLLSDFVCNLRRYCVHIVYKRSNTSGLPIQSGTSGDQCPLSSQTDTTLVSWRLSANVRLTSHVTLTTVRQWVIDVFISWLTRRLHVTATTCQLPHLNDGPNIISMYNDYLSVLFFCPA